VRHGEAIEADLLAHGVDLLDLYRGRLSIRRVCLLVEHWCLRRGTALAYSLHGELGRWLTSDEILASAYGVKRPESKAMTEWKAAQQARIRAERAKIAAQRQAAG
jgi:hypothetical protein